MRFSRFLLPITTVPALAFAIELAAQDNPSAPQPAATPPTETKSAGAQTAGPTIRSASNLVVVDVVVSDDGKPVKGLQRQAFHILEDGREQNVKVFEEHNSSDPSHMQIMPPLPPNTYSNFPETTVISAANVLLLDALNTPLKDQMYVRQQMIEYLKNIPDGSRIAIFTLASRLRLVQGFTADRTPLLAALNDKRNGPSVSPTLPDPDDTTPTKLVTGMQDVGASRQAIASLKEFQADQQAFQMDLQVQLTLDALNQLAGYLSGIPGRKNLIWFSGSFPLSLEPDVGLSDGSSVSGARNNQLRNTSGGVFSVAREYSDQLKATSDLLTASRVSVYPIDARGLFPPSMFNAANPNANYSGASHGVPSMPNAGGRVGGGAHARNPASGNRGNSNAFGSDNARFVQTTAAEHATMQQIAQETGGQAFYDSNAIRDALAAAIEDGENYYTLAYIPDNANFDGKFRRIQVKLPEQSHQVAYRQGYFADPPGAHSSNAPLSPSAAAIQRGAPPSSQILFKVRVLPSNDPELHGLESEPGAAGLMANKLNGAVKRYWLDYAADMHRVAMNVGSDGLHHLSVEFVALAYDRDGKILNVANRAFNLNLKSEQYNRIMQSGLPLHQELDVPAGEVYLRIAVHDLLTDRIGSVEIPLQLPDKPAHL
jgi:VWFA-related protein